MIKDMNGGILVVETSKEEGFYRAWDLDPSTMSFALEAFANTYLHDGEIPCAKVWREDAELGFLKAEYLPYTGKSGYLEVTDNEPSLGFYKPEPARLPYKEIYQDLFNKVRALYPRVAIGGLRTTRKEDCYYQGGKGHFVVMNVWAPPCVLLHELGHAYMEVYYPSEALNEAWAWDTAKSLALEIGYPWGPADEAVLLYSLAAYGVAPI